MSIKTREQAQRILDDEARGGAAAPPTAAQIKDAKEYLHINRPNIPPRRKKRENNGDDVDVDALVASLDAPKRRGKNKKPAIGRVVPRVYRQRGRQGHSRDIAPEGPGEFRRQPFENNGRNWQTTGDVHASNQNIDPKRIYEKPAGSHYITGLGLRELTPHITKDKGRTDNGRVIGGAWQNSKIRKETWSHENQFTAFTRSIIDLSDQAGNRESGSHQVGTFLRPAGGDFVNGLSRREFVNARPVLSYAETNAEHKDGCLYGAYRDGDRWRCIKNPVHRALVNPKPNMNHHHAPRGGGGDDGGGYGDGGDEGGGGGEGGDEAGGHRVVRVRRGSKIDLSLKRMRLRSNTPSTRSGKKRYN